MRSLETHADAGGQGTGSRGFTAGRGLGWESSGVGEGLEVCRHSLGSMVWITVEAPSSPMLLSSHDPQISLSPSKIE